MTSSRDTVKGDVQQSVFVTRDPSVTTPPRKEHFSVSFLFFFSAIVYRDVLDKNTRWRLCIEQSRYWSMRGVHGCVSCQPFLFTRVRWCCVQGIFTGNEMRKNMANDIQGPSEMDLNHNILNRSFLEVSYVLFVH